MGPVTAAIMWGKLTKELEIDAALKNMDRYSILSEKPVMVNWNELVYPVKTPQWHIHYNLVINFLSSKARDKFTSLLKSTYLMLKSNPLELLHGSSKLTIDYMTIHDLLQFIQKGKSPSTTKKQKPKASTVVSDISPTPQSHAENNTTDKNPKEHADKHKDSEKPNELEKPGETAVLPLLVTLLLALL
eukprot:m51a1_g10287 hypothetical protein (188) ;mRNA; r:4766-8630